MDCRAGQGAVEWKFTLPDDQVYAASDTKDQSGVCDCTQGGCVGTHRGCVQRHTGGVCGDTHKPKNEPKNEPKKEPLNEPPKQTTGCTPKQKNPAR